MAETKFFSIEDLGEMKPPEWLIEGIFETNTLVMVAGPPGSFKSFLVLDWLLCMACGRNWHGKRTIPQRVLYVLGEGRSSLLKRIQVWQHFYKPSEAELQKLVENFKVTFDVPQMAQKSSVDNMLSALAEIGYAPQVIAIDTFARSFVGMDENLQKDVGLWVDSADRLRGLGYTVIFLHHTAKNTEFGVRYRGSTAILGAMDTAMTLMRDPDMPGGVKLVVTKQKDHDEGDPLYFNRLIVTPKGWPEGSIVLVPTQKVDERFTEEGQKKELTQKELEKKTVDELIDGHPERSNRELARVLVKEFKLSDAAAYNRIQRARSTRGLTEPPDSFPDSSIQMNHLVNHL